MAWKLPSRGALGVFFFRLLAALIFLPVLAGLIFGVDRLAELPGARWVGESAFHVVVIGLIVFGIVGLILGGRGPKPSRPTRNERATNHAVAQERRLEQEEDTRDTGPI